ncbi:hypothetical protein JAAARDRAFT_488031 [Jaapia argillacea MUCL 33604]|uniref:Uncharacterized protein n=1 Tax=Jaapia argillacea MUCL 33604 TaxID=933084 RepID=A0A067PBJ8_9AGAM|nr:hypothetical protein JAAARDRAFT_488031 [Jaapia argillacea MUCL 33604]
MGETVGRVRPKGFFIRVHLCSPCFYCIASDMLGSVLAHEVKDRRSGACCNRLWALRPLPLGCRHCPHSNLCSHPPTTCAFTLFPPLTTRPHFPSRLNFVSAENHVIHDSRFPCRCELRSPGVPFRSEFRSFRPPRGVTIRTA